MTDLVLIDTRIRLRRHIYACMYVTVYVCKLHVCMCVCTYVHVCTCVCTYVHVCITMYHSSIVMFVLLTETSLSGI